MWCWVVNTLHKLLDSVASGACFLTGGVFECDIANHRSVTVKCLLNKIRCNPMHSLNVALLQPYVWVWVTCGALVTHRYTYVLPRCRTWQYRRTFVLLSKRSCIMNFVILHWMVRDWWISMTGPMPSYWSSCLLLRTIIILPPLVPLFYGPLHL